jgi:hypothetical protein
MVAFRKLKQRLTDTYFACGYFAVLLYACLQELFENWYFCQEQKEVGASRILCLQQSCPCSLLHPSTLPLRR